MRPGPPGEGRPEEATRKAEGYRRAGRATRRPGRVQGQTRAISIGDRVPARATHEAGLPRVSGSTYPLASRLRAKSSTP